MKLLASQNPFDVKAAILAGHVQHPVIIHFPIALFIASAVFEVLALWRKQPVLAAVAYYNLLGAAMSALFHSGDSAVGIRSFLKRLDRLGKSVFRSQQGRQPFAHRTAQPVITVTCE